MAIDSSRGTDAVPALVAQVRELYGRAAYTQKTHEKQADIYFSSHRNQRRVAIGLTVVSSGTFLASLAGLVVSDEWASLVISFVALLVSAASLSGKTFSYGEDAQKHRDVAARVWDLRESYLSLLVDLQSRAISAEDARARRDDLQRLGFEVHQEAPRTTAKAYIAAQEALQLKEDLTFSDAELDQLLPNELRKLKGEGENAGL